MEQYKYPVRFFCSSDTSNLSQVLIGNLSFFESKFSVKSPILGETGIEDVLIDFNDGLRLQIPKGNWHVKISDYSNNLIFIDEDIFEGVTLISMEKFFVHWEIVLSFDNEVCFYHQFDPSEQNIHFHFPGNAIGDNITFFAYMNEFKRNYNCQVTCTVPKIMREIVKLYYTDVNLVDKLPDDTYATFYMVGQNFNELLVATENIRSMPLQKFGQAILGWKIKTPKKIIYKATEERKIQEPYICIAVQASGTPKAWLNPNGWNIIIDYLKQLGYRVLCIDKDRETSDYGNVVKIPAGAEDFTGNLSLIDRINLLAYADFFIGLSSGLAWLAWSVDIPVILISGITKPWYEFDTPYRIYNNLVCHGCFNDMNIEFNEVFNCPYHKATSKMYECSKKISAQQVVDAIDKVVSLK